MKQKTIALHKEANPTADISPYAIVESTKQLIFPSRIGAETGGHRDMVTEKSAATRRILTEINFNGDETGLWLESFGHVGGSTAAFIHTEINHLETELHHGRHQVAPDTISLIWNVQNDLSPHFFEALLIVLGEHTAPVRTPQILLDMANEETLAGVLGAILEYKISDLHAAGVGDVPGAGVDDEDDDDVEPSLFSDDQDKVWTVLYCNDGRLLRHRHGRQTRIRYAPNPSPNRRIESRLPR